MVTTFKPTPLYGAKNIIPSLNIQFVPDIVCWKDFVLLEACQEIPQLTNRGIAGILANL
jgi:hypothetical protein